MLLRNHLKKNFQLPNQRKVRNRLCSIDSLPKRQQQQNAATQAVYTQTERNAQQRPPRGATARTSPPRKHAATTTSLAEAFISKFRRLARLIAAAAFPAGTCANFREPIARMQLSTYTYTYIYSPLSRLLALDLPCAHASNWLRMRESN